MLLQMKDTQQPCSFGWGFRWVKGRFGSGSRPVLLGMGFCTGEGSFLLKVKACGAWDGVLVSALAPGVVYCVHSDDAEHLSKLSALEKELRLFSTSKRHLMAQYSQ